MLLPLVTVFFLAQQYDSRPQRPTDVPGTTPTGPAKPPTYAGPLDLRPGFGRADPGSGGQGGTTAPSAPGGSAPPTSGPGVVGPRAPVGSPSGPGGAGRLGPSTGGHGSGIDEASWEAWWALNQDEFLALRRHIDAVATGASTGDDLAELVDWDRVGERIVDAGLQLVRESNDDAVVRRGLLALARACDGRSRANAAAIADACLGQVGSASQPAAEAAVVSLGVLGHEASAPVLVHLLDDAEPARARLGGRAVPTRMRALSAYALGLLAERATNDDVRRFVAHHLARTLDLVRGSDELELGSAVVLALGLCGSASAIPPAEGARAAPSAHPAGTEQLFASLVDARRAWGLRAHVPRSLARRATRAADRERVMEALLARIADANEHNAVVQGALLALGDIAEPTKEPLDVAVRAALARATESGDVLAREFAVVSLARIGAREPDGDAAAEVRARLVQRLARGNQRERGFAALALGLLEHGRDPEDPPAKASAEALVRALATARAPEEFGAAAIGAGLARARQALPLLTKTLEEDTTPATITHAATALGLLGAPEGRESLRARLAAAERRLHELPSIALGCALLEDQALVPALVELIAREHGSHAREATCAALALVGDDRAVAPLLELLSSRDCAPSTRAATITALGRIGDRATFAWKSLYGRSLGYAAIPSTLADASGSGLLDLD